MDSRLIITGASESYADSLLALIGSINVNWPLHPRILVYDLGLSSQTTATLDKAGIEVREIPPFCPHWQKHFTWKIWCLYDAPCESFLWLDAGTCVLRPFDEAFAATIALGYFAPTNGWTLKTGVCESLRSVVGLESATLDEMLSISACVFGLKKEGPGLKLIEEAFQLSLVEANMRATEPLHRHDQALLSLLLHKHFAPVVFADHIVYAGWDSAQQFAVQKVWVHRRSLRANDQRYYAEHIAFAGRPHLPDPPQPSRFSCVAKVINIVRRVFTADKNPFRLYDGIRK